jgi:hypothetical protein
MKKKKDLLKVIYRAEITMNNIEQERWEHFSYVHGPQHNIYIEKCGKSGIGENFIAHCISCNTKADITDYDTW